MWEPVVRVNKKCYHQTLLEEFKYVIKKTKMESFINDEWNQVHLMMKRIVTLIMNLTMNPTMMDLKNLTMNLTMDNLLINLRIKTIF